MAARKKSKKKVAKKAPKKATSGRAKARSARARGGPPGKSAVEIIRNSRVFQNFDDSHVDFINNARMTLEEARAFVLAARPLMRFQHPPNQQRDCPRLPFACF